MKKIIIIFLFCFLFIQSLFSLSIDEYLNIINPLTQDSQWQAAEKIIDNALKEHNDSITLYVYATWILRELKKFDKALTIIEPAIKKFPESQELKNELCYIETGFSWQLIDQKKISEALIHAEKAYKINPDNEFAINAYGYTLILSKKFDNAVSVLSEGLKKNLESKYLKQTLTYAYYESSEDYYNKKNSDEYKKAILKAYEISPDTDYIINALGICYIRTKEYEKAIETIKNGLIKYPDYKWFKENLSWAYSEFADVMKDQNKLEDYFNLKKLAYETAPEKDWVINDYAASLIVKKDFENAVKLLLDGKIKYPNYKYYKNTLTWAYADYANYFKEKNDLENFFKYKKLAFDNSPETDWIINDYAVSLIEKKDYENAIRLFKEGLIKYPDYKWFKENLSWAYREYANYFDKKSDYKNAVYYYKLDFEANPDKDYSINGYGWELCKAQKYFNYSKEISEHIVFLKNKIEKTSNFDEVKNYLSIFQELILIVRNEKFFYEFYPVLEKKFPEEDKLLIWIGSIMSYLNNVSGNIKTDIRDKALNYVKKGMIIFENKNPNRLVIKELYYPVKGSSLIVSEFDDPEAVTHNGYLKYSYDIMVADEKGNLIKPGTSGNKNEDYYCFGIPVYAASDGIIEGAEDDIPDLEINKPGYYGNHLGIKTDSGYFIWYEHLKYKSIKVKNGDKVVKGQLIAEIGNSGYSFCPHLHFCIFDADYITMKFYFEKLQVKENGVFINNDGILKRKMTVIKN